MSYRFILNETAYFGRGARQELYAEVKKRGYKKACVVADKDLIKFGPVKMGTDTRLRLPAQPPKSP